VARRQPAEDEATRPQVETGVDVDEDGNAMTWSSLTVKINLGNYESAEVSLGTRVPVSNNDASIRRAHRQLLRRHTSLIEPKVAEVREQWGHVG
jgi:hypothetical protein